MGSVVALALTLLTVLGTGCAAPQRSGGERTAYLSMATVSGGLVGAIGSVTTCLFLRYGLSHPRGGRDSMDNVCLATGAILGGGAALYGSLETDDRPEASHWVVISLGTITAVAAVVNRLTSDD